ncbi:GNAT family N-acetyltransferase [Thalassotalea piscium]
MEIKIDNLESSTVKQLLHEHHEEMLKHSPAESVHALNLDSLKTPEITFWTAWINGELAGCAALKKLDDTDAEIKSMRTANEFLRKGVAAKLLTHILSFAKGQSYQIVSLETGTANAFIPAQTLYKRFGFHVCQPFSTYQKDPYSMFLTKVIN